MVKKAGKRITLSMLAGLSAMILLFVLDLLTGSIRSLDSDLITLLRLPRALTAALCGASLSLSGLQMQSVFRNPLCDPHIMGVSSGASLGAALSVMGAAVLGTGTQGLVAGALAGSVAVSLSVLYVSRRGAGASTLLLFGVLLGFVISAFTTTLGYLAPEQNLKLFYSWSSGSFSGTDAGRIAVLGITLLVCSAIALANSRGLDLLLFGDDISRLAAVSPQKTRFLALFATCCLTAVCTAFCGPVGFVGIAAPHVCRRISGTSRHYVLIPLSILVGASFALLADITSRIFGIVLPVGSTMALLGIPVIMLMLKERKLW